MNNPIAHLFAQAETGLSDLSRRALDSVTMPIRAKSQEMVAEVTAAVKASLVGIAIKAALGVFAGVMFIVALCYGLSALHADLALRVGPIEATLIVGGIFLALAIVALLALVFWPTAKPAKAVAASTMRAVRDAEAVADKTRRSAEAVGVAATRPPEADAAASNPLADMKSGLGAIASALGEAGFRREQAGLRAGLAIAEQLKPMQIVSLALIGGFVAGVRVRRRR